MAWIRRKELATLREEVRAISSVPWMDASQVPGIPFGDGGPARPSQLGGGGVDGALSLAPVYAACRVLADGIASLPIIVNTMDDGQPVPYPGPSMFAPGRSPSASPHTTLYDWVHQAMTSLALEGNAFGWIATRDGMGYPTTIEWMPPSLVYIDEDETSPVPNPLRVKYYYKGRLIPTEDILHIRAFTLPGRMRAISPMKAFMALISQGRSMAEYGQSWFAAGGFPPGVLKSTAQTVDEEQSNQIKRTVTRAIRSRQPLVIGSDWEYNAVIVPPEQAQFIQSTQMTATQIAAVYGIDPERIGGQRGGNLTYSSIEMNAIELVTTTLRPWVARWEQALWPVLPGQRHVKFNVDAATYAAVDATQRHAIFKSDRDMGYRTTDEMRATEGLAALPRGAGADQRPQQWLIGAVRGAADLGLDKYGAPQDDLTKLPPASVPGEADPVNLADDSVSVPPLAVPPAPATPELSPPGKAPKALSGPVRSVEDIARMWAGKTITLGQLKYLRAEVSMHARRGGIAVGGFNEPAFDDAQMRWLLSVLKANGFPAEARMLAPTNGHKPAKAASI